MKSGSEFPEQEGMRLAITLEDGTRSWTFLIGQNHHLVPQGRLGGTPGCSETHPPWVNHGRVGQRRPLGSVLGTESFQSQRCRKHALRR